jgi:hypothetical protein
MAIELLITENGMAFNREIFNDDPPKYMNINAMEKDNNITGNNAIANDFLINGNLVILNSSSSEPSSTMRIRPNVPSIGSSAVRFGIFIFSIAEPCCTSHPKNSNSKTDGILVLDEVRSKI